MGFVHCRTVIRAWTSLREESAEADRTQSILRTTTELLSSLKDAETGQRGYLLTGDVNYLEPYNRAKTEIPVFLDRLNHLVLMVTQVARLRELEPLLAEKMSELSGTIQLRQTKGLEAALAVVRTNRGVAVMDRIRVLCASIDDASASRSARFSELSRSSASRLGLVATLGSACLFVLIFLATTTVHKETQRRLRLLNASRQSEQNALKKEQEKNALLASIVASSDNAIISKTLEGIVTSWNASAERLFGFTAEEVIGQNIRLIIPPDKQEEESQILNRLREGRTLQHFETERRTKSGKIVPVSITVSPVPDATDTVVGASKIARDISYRIQAQERFRVVFEAAPSAMLMTDREGKITLMNGETERLFGYQRDELLGQTLEVLVPERLRAKHRGFRTEFFSAPLAVAPRAMGRGAELFGVRKDGSEFPVQISLSPVQTDAGMAVISAIIDITESKRVEETIRKFNEVLERRVKERTAEVELARQQLQTVLDGSTNVSIIATDAVGVISLFNSGAENMLGYKAEEVVGKQTTSIFHLESEALAREDELAAETGRQVRGFDVFVDRARQGQADEREWTYVRKDGSHLTVNLVVTSLRESGGSIIGFLGVALDVSARKQAEEGIRAVAAQLQRNEARFRAYVEQAGDPIFVHDFSGRFIEVNQQACASLGYTREELLSLTVVDIETQFDLLSAQAAWSKINPAESYRLEGIHRRKNGSTFPVEAKFGCFDFDGQRSYLTIVRDMSDRKATEAAARASAEHFRLIVEAVQDYALIMLDPEGHVISWNIGAERIEGYRAEEIIGQHFSCFYIPEDIEKRHPNEELHKAVEHGRYAEEDWRVKKDGSRFFAEAVVTPIYSDSGALLGFAKVVHDLTSRKRTDDELKSSAARLSLATHILGAGVWDWDLRTNESVWDEAIREMYGLTKDAPVGYKEWANSVLPEDFPAVEKSLQNAIATKWRGSAEFRIVLHDGSVRHIRDAHGVILDEAGQPIRMVGVQLDITGQKLNEMRLSEQTAQLRAINKELEEFAYVASHDLKAPLRAIDNASKWIEEDLGDHLSGEARENMELLRGRVRRMEKLLDDLLEYARIGRAFDDRYFALISGDALIKNILALLSPQGFDIQASAAFASIQVAQMPLQQILMNLIGNAIKHHHKKEGHIELTVDERGPFYLFSVRDDGPGIAKRFHEQIFKMFQTLRPRDQVEGSGMGLAMVRKNIELCGGTVWLESEEGRGSTFRFTWPKSQQQKKGAVA